MSTYEKLGQYASSELPIAPSNLAITAAYSTSADLEWTNNNGTSGVIIAQLWMSNYWLTKNEFDISATGGTITELPSGESWRIRVAVLLDGVIYPCQPVVNELPPIPLPTNFAMNSQDLWTATFTWDGNDSSWEEIKLMVVTGESGIEYTFATVATLASGATQAITTGYTWNKNYTTNWKVCAVISGSDNCSELIYPYGLVNCSDDSMWIGGTAIKTDWSDNWNSDSKRVNKISEVSGNYQFWKFSTIGYDFIYMYQNGTFTIRANKDFPVANPPEFPELLFTDFISTSANLENNGDGTFKFTGSEGIYNVEMDMSQKSISITAA